ncbi:abc transporter permease protein domain [Trichococcus flocculiformis]|uniref:ABC transport system permease protein n=1 Tax=Trichococcus flocculiformis TaxID=82803 RepID=A0AB38BK01_9LACT|nr:FtsX-like permease family protein [Trichococcus flocculiformis]CZQ95115.1 abc transporter permease protein domain [Trichococcus flocculiformis]SFI02935.1 putative ABC transport system permease protein [Trichococcus flocculiformis]
MKKKALWKDIWIEIGKSKARFLALLAIITLGVAFFAGIKAAGPDMLDTANQYYEDNNLYDLKVLSTYGLEEADIAILDETADLSVHPMRTVDIEMEGSDFLVKVFPLQSGADPVNAYALVDGRLPETSGEVALDAKQNLSSTYQIGDTITFRHESDEDLSDEEKENRISLKEQEYTVVGFVDSPMYIETIMRGSTNVGKGSLDAFVVVPESDILGSIYTEAYLTMAPTVAETGYTDAYDEQVDRLADEVELALNGRPLERINEIRAEGQRKIRDAEDELQEGKDKLAEAEQELQDARQQLDDGTALYEENRQLFLDKIAQAESTLTASQAEIDAGMAEYRAGLATYLENKALYDEAKVAWEAQKKALQGQNDSDASLDALLASLPDTPEGREIAELAQMLLDGQAEVEATQSSLEMKALELQERAAALASKGELLLAEQMSLEADAAAYQKELAIFTADMMAFQTEKAIKQAEFSTRQAAIDSERAALEELDPETDPSVAERLTALDEEQAALDAERAALAQAETELTVHQSELEQEGASLSTRQEALTAAAAAFQAERASEEAALLEEQRLLESAGNELAARGEELLDQQQLLEEKIAAFMADAEAQIAAADAQFAEQGIALENGRLELASAFSQLEDGQIQINNGWSELESQRVSGEQALGEAWQEIQQGEAAYQEGLVTFTAERVDAEIEIADGERQVAEAKQALADLIEPVYYVTDRSGNPGYQEYRDNADRISAIAEIFPVFFFLIAALVSFTTMARMVDEQRQQMGTLKGLGYSDFDIAKKYLIYAAIACIVGTSLGLVAGYNIFPAVIFDAYGSMYSLPSVKITYYLSYALISIAIALLCTIGPAAWAAHASLRENPAMMMRPKAPKNGKRVLLERVTFIWDRLSFNSKITVRNLMRYKARNMMTILGVAGCTALILTGYGIKNSISGLADTQFNDVMRYNAITAMRPEASAEEIASYDELVAATPEITDHLKVVQESYKLDKKGVNLQNVTVFAPLESENLPDFVSLRDRITQEPIALTDEGAVISEKLANLADVGPGDSIEIRNDEMQTYQIPIQAVTENYVNHYIYLTPSLYEEIFIQAVEPTTDLLLFDEPESWERSFGSEVMGEQAVALVTFINSVDRSFAETLGSLDVVTLVLIVSAASLAFVVLYSLTNINVSERIRELSTIKVLGFYDVEVSMYIYRESLVLTLLGILFGFVLGKILSTVVLKMVEIDFMMFPPTIMPISYLYAGLLSLLFSSVVMLIMHRKLKQVDMIEALKSVE